MEVVGQQQQPLLVIRERLRPGRPHDERAIEAVHALHARVAVPPIRAGRLLHLRRGARRGMTTLPLPARAASSTMRGLALAVHLADAVTLSCCVIAATQAHGRRTGCSNYSLVRCHSRKAARRLRAAGRARAGCVHPPTGKLSRTAVCLGLAPARAPRAGGGRGTVKRYVKLLPAMMGHCCR